MTSSPSTPTAWRRASSTSATSSPSSSRRRARSTRRRRAKVAEKFATDSFTLDDFLKQMQQLRNMGSIKGMLGMLPGARGMREALDNFDEREIVRTEAIIQSMTKAERTTPKLLNGSRRLRIAKGSGSTVTDVNQLVQRFEQASKMMKTVAKGGRAAGSGHGPGSRSDLRRRAARQGQAAAEEGVAQRQPREACGRECGTRRGREARDVERFRVRSRRSGRHSAADPRRAREDARTLKSGADVPIRPRASPG